MTPCIAFRKSAVFQNQYQTHTPWLADTRQPFLQYAGPRPLLFSAARKEVLFHLTAG